MHSALQRLSTHRLVANTNTHRHTATTTVGSFDGEYCTDGIRGGLCRAMSCPTEEDTIQNSECVELSCCFDAAEAQPAEADAEPNSTPAEPPAETPPEESVAAPTTTTCASGDDTTIKTYAAALITAAEAFCSFCYIDDFNNANIPTVAIGINLNSNAGTLKSVLSLSDADVEKVKTNDLSLTEAQGQSLLTHEIDSRLIAVKAYVSNFATLPLPMQAVLVDMWFNGVTKFPNLRTCLAATPIDWTDGCVLKELKYTPSSRSNRNIEVITNMASRCTAPTTSSAGTLTKNPCGQTTPPKPTVSCTTYKLNW